MKLEPENFPIDRYVEQIAQSSQENPSLLIRAETGAGKTTRLPPYLLTKTPGKILVLEPRRLAAKLSAARCAQTLGESIGETVGHHIRFDKCAGERTRLLFITEGLFLPYLLQDQELKEYSLILLDEFHERSIHTDVALALIRKLQATTRPDLKLIIMSATLETDKLESYLASPKVFNVPGRTFPIEIEYRPPQIQGEGRRRGAQPWDEAAADAVESMLADPRCKLNVLVFLPGMGEIIKLQQKLQRRVSAETEIVPLHSSLPKELQNKAFTGDRRKVILSTNIAETSLTIPNVTGVIDLGNERRASFAPWSGMPLLQLEKTSKASATQRAGRAGRTTSGLVYRFYSEADHSQRAPFTPPDVKRVELSHHVLDLIELGHHPDNLDWFEAPEEKNLNTAIELLNILGALKDGAITPLGRFLAKLPLHPRFGAMLYQCPKDTLPDALLGACVISEGMVLAKSAEFGQDDEEVCDLCLQLDLIKADCWGDKSLSDYSRHYLDRKKAKRALELYENLAPRLGAPKRPPRTKTSHKDLSARLLAGFPDRVAAKRVAKSKGRQVLSYNFCLGRGGRLSLRSSLSGSSPDFLIVLDALEDPKANAATGTSIQAASKIEAEELLKPSPFLSNEKETSFNEKKGTLTITSSTKYGKVTVATEARPPVVPKGNALVGLMKENWPWPFNSDEELRLHNKRVRLLAQSGIENQLPEFKDDMFELFLESCVDDETTYQDLQNAGLEELIRQQLAPQDEYVLESEVPRSLKLENGKSFEVSYDEELPYIQARIQDLFSVTSHPAIAQGKIHLTVKLLSPANRVAQVVRDLPGFWKSSWSDVRKELKARYPKHFWPDDPATAEPRRVSKKR